MEQAYHYKINENQTITIYRIYGNHMELTIPETIDGLKVTKIGSYCFSLSSHVPKDCLLSGNPSFECAGKNIQAIFLPDTIEYIDSHAFYNCRKLEEISFPGSLKDIGSDVFVNSTNLQTIHIRSSYMCPTILKQILRQISWDVEVYYQDLTLFFPEYYELYNEIGPAHIFGMNIEGEGFRLRQCFKQGIIDLDAFDHSFEKLCAEESNKTLIHFALIRFMNNSSRYAEYIKEHQSDILSYKNLSLEMIECLLEQKVLSQESLDTFISIHSSPEIITSLITLKKKYFRKKNMYSFEDFDL